MKSNEDMTTIENIISGKQSLENPAIAEFQGWLSSLLFSCTVC